MIGHLIFILNCGSSSIKFMVQEVEAKEAVLEGIAENVLSNDCILTWVHHNQIKQKPLTNSDYSSVLLEILGLIREHEKKIVVIGHRVVHGGEYFSSSVLINDHVLEKIRECIPLAPLHNPANLIGIEVVRKEFPNTPQVAVFDTAFHQTLPNYAYLYPLPYSYYQKYGVRRYGFHGTSHRFVVEEAAKKIGKPLEETAFISAHLGNGCSLSAVLGGESIDTSMGMTPLEGLVMGTRSGDIDPSLTDYLAKKLHIGTEEVVDILNHKSGLLGISGVSEDMRLLEKEAARGNKRADLAIEVFCYRLAKYIASYMVPLGRLDGLIFTGGIGKNSSLVRFKTVQWLSPFTLTLDEKRNQDHGKRSGGVISVEKHTPFIMVIPTHEEWIIAQDAMRLIKEKS
jgi:acetate kinase